MKNIIISGYKELSIEYLVLDYNGTLACDGQLLDGVSSLLNNIAEHIHLHVVTADTFGRVESSLEKIPCKLKILPEALQAEAKQRYVQNLGSDRTAAIGNGRNDRLMLKEAILGIAVLGQEGTSVESIISADVLCNSIYDALNLLLQSKRLVATLRS